MAFENDSYEYIYKTRSLSNKHRETTIRHLFLDNKNFMDNIMYISL